MKTLYQFVRYGFLIFIFLCNLAGLVGQSERNQDRTEFSQFGVIEDLIQSYVEARADDGDFDYNTFLDRLDYFQKHRLNPNNLSDLEDFILLRPSQVSALKTYIEANGPLISMYELQAVPEFDINTIKLIEPFISLDGNLDQYEMSLVDIIAQSTHQLFLRTGRTLESQIGYEKNPARSRYEGSPYRLYFRYRQTYENKFSLGITGEKDPGESFFNGKNKKGFDYNSFHASIRKLNKTVEDLVLGDFSISFGQGLLIHSGFGVGKSPWSTNIRKGDRSVRAYTSVNESNFFRGAAATINLSKQLHATIFGSLRHKDANIIGDSIDREARFSSFQESGYHRTPSEIEDEKSLAEMTYGAALKYHFSQGHLSLNTMSSHFDKSFLKSDQPYNYFAFKGNTLFQTSLDHSFYLKNFSFFGEVALSNPGSYAWMEGLQLALDKKVDIALLYRHLDKAYPAIYSNAFNENTLASNENGLYLGAEIRPAARWKIGVYWDVWRHPWLRYGVQGPSMGHEQLIRISYSIRRKMELYAQLRNKEREENQSDQNPIHTLVDQSKRSLRLNFKYTWSRALESRTRAEYTDYSKSDFQAQGWMIYQDLMYHPWESVLSFTTRLAYFDTDNYDSGIYAYENDLLYNFYVPNYYGRGWRYYLNVRYDIVRPLTLEVRYAITALNQATTIGSGLDLINGSHRSEIKFQMRYTF